eukprot:gnl/TRDRNA2_/TRDRNA2_172013_c5_seq7.p1 gnl/TRDRNA2_/TRDRNA2_172013_c5~~gnl/TRDRNA2_/TRDRNA2_172013_c5_seq7.p1  ORF type:complete len:394 (+),score=48.21 gnl/TRDRNA2_/TRDRNA2_172013_c5_seq7:103-1284(+)
MKILAKPLKGESFEVEMEPEDKVEDVKKRIAGMKPEFPAELQKLICAGKILADGSRISDCGIKPSDFLVVMVAKPKAPAATAAGGPAATATGGYSAGASVPAPAALHSVRPSGGSVPVASVVQRLPNKHGCCDLGQAFLSTPRGRGLLPKFVPKSSDFCSGSTAGTFSDEDFHTVLASLDTASYEVLWAVHILTGQEDAGALNLMLRATERGKFALVLIDTCDSFGATRGQGFDSSSSSSSSSSGGSSDSESGSSASGSSSSSVPDGVMDDMLMLRGPEFEYPLILEMWPAMQPASDLLQNWMAVLDSAKFAALLYQDEYMQAVSDEERSVAMDRLAALKKEVDVPGKTLRDMAFSVVPAWQGAWERVSATGHPRPILEVSEKVFAERSLLTC